MVLIVKVYGLDSGRHARQEMAQQQKAQEAQHGDERERWTAAQAGHSVCVTSLAEAPSL